MLIFSNPAQQLETRHLASLAALPSLTSLTLQACFHSEACNFSAALGPCSRLARLVVLPHEVAKGLTDGHVASLAGGWRWWVRPQQEGWWTAQRPCAAAAQGSMRSDLGWEHHMLLGRACCALAAPVVPVTRAVAACADPVSST